MTQRENEKGMGGKDVKRGLTRAMFFRRSALAGGAVLGAGTLLAGCGQSEEGGQGSGGGTVSSAYDKAVRNKVGGRTLTIGFTPPALSEFYDEIEHGAWRKMDEYQRRFGIQWKWVRSAPSEHEAVESQVNTIQDWATKEFDAILVCTAGDFASMQGVYEAAEKKGTAIFQFNMPAELWDVEDIKATSTIGYNNAQQAGFIVGKYLAQKLNGKGKILQIWGLPGHWSTSRENGLKMAIDQYPGLEIVGKQRGDYVRDKGLNAAQNLLESNPDVDAIYGENEEMALGAAQAIDAQGLKHWDGKEGIITIGADGLESGYEAIQAGKLTATVDVGPVDQGAQSVETIFDSLVLGYTVDPIINVPTTVVDKSNVDVHLAYVQWALDGPEYGR
jgi:ribose transport system substrate-binding protein